MALRVLKRWQACRLLPLELPCISGERITWREDSDMATTAMVHVRVDELVKEQASEALASMLEFPAEEARPGPLRRRGLSPPVFEEDVLLGRNAVDECHP